MDGTDSYVMVGVASLLAVVAFGAPKGYLPGRAKRPGPTLCTH